MKETVKHSVKVIIDEGEDVEEKVAHVTQEAIGNALSTGRLSAQKVKEVSETVLLAAVEAAQEAGKEVKETTKGAAEGAKEGVVNSIEKAKTKLEKAKDEAKDKAEDFVEEDIKQTIEDLEAMNDAFMEALGTTAHKVGDVAQEVLHESIAGMKQGASQIRERAEDAVEVAIDYLTEKGSQVAYSAKEKALDAAEAAYDETAELAEKMVKITKGAFSSMVEGAKKAMKKDEEK